MTKTKDNTRRLKETKDKEAKGKETKDKEPKNKELKGKSNLVGRVKKVIKKSRRKLGEEKFEKQLRRTIEFLAELQTKLDKQLDSSQRGPPLAPVDKKSAPRAGQPAHHSRRQ